MLQWPTGYNSTLDGFLVVGYKHTTVFLATRVAKEGLGSGIWFTIFDLVAYNYYAFGRCIVVDGNFTHTKNVSTGGTGNYIMYDEKIAVSTSIFSF